MMIRSTSNNESHSLSSQPLHTGIPTKRGEASLINVFSEHYNKTISVLASCHTFISRHLKSMTRGESSPLTEASTIHLCWNSLFADNTDNTNRSTHIFPPSRWYRSEKNTADNTQPLINKTQTKNLKSSDVGMVFSTQKQ